MRTVLAIWLLIIMCTVFTVSTEGTAFGAVRLKSAAHCCMNMTPGKRCCMSMGEGCSCCKGHSCHCVSTSKHEVTCRCAEHLLPRGSGSPAVLQGESAWVAFVPNTFRIFVPAVASVLPFVFGYSSSYFVHSVTPLVPPPR